MNRITPGLTSPPLHRVDHEWVWNANANAAPMLDTHRIGRISRPVSLVIFERRQSAKGAA
jgi:hypothetical protein